MNFSSNSKINYHSDFDVNDWSFVHENTTKFLVPSSALKYSEPSKFPVFFNPAAKFNRDVSIYIYKTFLKGRKDKDNSFVDTMTGSGVRGLRVAKEIPSVNRIIFNDINSFSIYISKINTILNNIYNKCDFYNKEICNFLSTVFNFEKRATIIDIDPFGSPAPYLDCVLRSVENGGLVSVTATDTAVLSGVYPKVCFRKYFGNSLRTKYSEEIGIRLLISSIALIASRMDLSVLPIFSHSYRNYVRVYCKVIKSNYFANMVQEKLGYVVHCFNCANRYLIKKPYRIMDCNICHNKVTIGGPMWISNLFEKELVSQIISSIVESGSQTTQSKALKDFFTVALEEIDDLPYHYINDEIGKVLKTNVMSIDNILSLLKKNGYLSSKTIFATNGFKTDASLLDLKKLLN